ncbi:hypothetical protein LCGC14_1618620 [marine sediment metagenome]|uniref:Uncharacterized protein n=1 Tax=marine sediment metagenome TaxID=412755 RepID=A0A0F9IT27_9ZZZZ
MYNEPMPKVEPTCPRCGRSNAIPLWEAEHKPGEMARVACPTCGWEPDNPKFVAQLQVVFAFQSMLEDLTRRAKKANMKSEGPPL